MISVAVVGLVIVLLIVLLATGGSSPNKGTGTSTAAKSKAARPRRHATAAPAAQTSTQPLVALSLKPTAEVYVCLIGDNGRRVIPGEELHAGTKTPTYHAHHFTITLGNSSVTMYVDGHARVVAPSSQAIGYSINSAGQRKRLAQGSLPTCL
jgi:hypothetical protein